tara:strand:+ start:970 stop:1161 length:192 start_codon:yes stop_codon:yes gene_type:complete
MNFKSVNKIEQFLKYELNLNESTILLGKKLSYKNETSLAITLWSYGIINSEELDKFYKFLYEN